METEHELDELQVLWRQLSSGEHLTILAPFPVLSRLDCVKEAMSAELLHLNQHSSNRKVAVIAFSEDVRLVSIAPSSGLIESESVKSLDEGLSVGRALKSNWDASAEELIQHIQGLDVEGATALGLALAVALGVVLQLDRSVGFHDVFLCTDGASNVGIGDVDVSNDPEHGRAFYERAGQIASRNKTKVHMLGIEGEGVSLDIISAAANASGGTSHVVDIYDLHRGLRAALRKRIVASNVLVTLQIQRGWHFNADARTSVKLDDDERTLSYTCAQVDDAAAISFAFSPDVHGDPAFADPGSVTIQARVEWTTPTNARRVRILNHSVPTTSDSRQAQEQSNVAVITMHVLQQVGHRMGSLLPEGPAHWPAAQQAAAECRGSLSALAQTLTKSAPSGHHMEETYICANEIAELDQILVHVFGSGQDFPQGSRRDHVAESLDHFAAIAREDLTATLKKTARVLRGAELKQ